MHFHSKGYQPHKMIENALETAIRESSLPSSSSPIYPHLWLRSECLTSLLLVQTFIQLMTMIEEAEPSLWTMLISLVISSSSSCPAVSIRLRISLNTSFSGRTGQIGSSQWPWIVHELFEQEHDHDRYTIANKLSISIHQCPAHCCLQWLAKAGQVDRLNYKISLQRIRFFMQNHFFDSRTPQVDGWINLLLRMRSLSSGPFELRLNQTWFKNKLSLS